MATVALNVSGKSNLSPQDWEQAALEWIAEHGVAALKVEPLARRLGITKGSFYWHFSDREQLLMQSLLRWEHLDRESVARFVEREQPPYDKLADFFRGTSRQHLTHNIYGALLSAPRNADIAAILQRVTQYRMDFLNNEYLAMGLDAEQARLHTQLTYSAYVGFVQLQRQQLSAMIDDAEPLDYTEHVIAVLLDGARELAAGRTPQRS
ncbi:MAG: TetR/AcrR family transcriptional regulator [Gammaproteobacteria bacterium]|nr:TetR/AcrR family transcriptional regulator [Gammaproteobacteria bacterium]